MKFINPDSKVYQILSTAASFIALNVLWLLCSAPLLTAGASTAALYVITRKMARHEYPSILPDFFKAFRENFKKATLASLILLLPLLLMVLYLFVGIAGGADARPGLRLFCWIAVAVIGVVSSYLWPLLAWFENSLGNTLRNAMLLPLSNPFIALAVTALNLLPLYLLLTRTTFFLQISFLWLVAGFALTAFVNTQLLRFQFRHLMQEEDASSDSSREI